MARSVDFFATKRVLSKTGRHLEGAALDEETVFDVPYRLWSNELSHQICARLRHQVCLGGGEGCNHLAGLRYELTVPCDSKMPRVRCGTVFDAVDGAAWNKESPDDCRTTEKRRPGHEGPGPKKKGGGRYIHRVDMQDLPHIHTTRWRRKQRARRLVVSLPGERGGGASISKLGIYAFVNDPPTRACER